MKILEFKINPTSSFITPLNSDTIFGHLCWQIAQIDGQQKLESFLKEFNQIPLFVISNAMPSNKFIKPFIIIPEKDKKKNKKQEIEAMELLKEYKKIKYIKGSNFKKTIKGISYQEFEKIIKQEIEYKRKDKIISKEEIILKNVIERNTNITKDGGIFNQVEFFHSNDMSIYFKIFNENIWEEMNIQDRIEQIFILGYGAKKSTGKGVFQVKEWKERKDLTLLPDAEYSILLSNCILKKKEREEILKDSVYQVKIKYGKLGESFSHKKNPFKSPLIQLLPGSILKTNKKYLGRMINISSKKIVQDFNYGFLLPFNHKNNE